MKYTVSMKVEGRVYVDVEAANADEAFENAKEAFMDVEIDKDNFEFVDAEPANCEDAEGNLTYWFSCL
jgi:SHS2 domain-containing protein